MSDALDEFVSVLNKRLTVHLQLIHNLERRITTAEKRLEDMELMQPDIDDEPPSGGPA